MTVSPTACKKRMQLTIMWSWKRVLPQLNLRVRPDRHFDGGFQMRLGSREPSKFRFGLLIHRNCDIINVCCFKRLNLLYFVTQQHVTNIP